MKKKIFSLLIAMVAAATSVQAQTITAVAPNGATTLYQSLSEAIERADPGSILYLPGGGFPTSDEDVITKKLMIMGIGHKAINDNADGITTIVGNLRFGKGSDGSSVMGCYINNNIYIAQDGQVNDVLIKKCSFDWVYVQNNACRGTVISQNYVRGCADFGGSEATVKNNNIHNVRWMSNGVISDNIFRACLCSSSYDNTFLTGITTATVAGNILLGTDNYRITNSCGTLYTSGNARLNKEWGDDPVKIEAENWDAVFENYNGAATNSYTDLHFKDAFKQYERQVGIYAGDGFDDTQLAPTPRIVRKEIPDQTDAAGKLNIKIRVKASE